MTKPTFIPTIPEIARETLIVIGGAIVAAAIIGNLAPVREWIKRQWAGTPNPQNPWN